MINAFWLASSTHHKKVLVLRCKVLVLVLNTRLGLCLGLEIKVLVLILVLTESLDYITALWTSPKVSLNVQYIVLNKNAC